MESEFYQISIIRTDISFRGNHKHDSEGGGGGGRMKTCEICGGGGGGNGELMEEELAGWGSRRRWVKGWGEGGRNRGRYMRGWGGGWRDANLRSGSAAPRPLKQREQRTWRTALLRPSTPPCEARDVHLN